MTADEKRREKAKQLRYRKPIVRDLNLWKIREELNDITEECYNVKYYWDGDDDTLINALDGDEDDAYEFKMMFSDLCAECDRMLEDLENEYVPECFDTLFVAARAGRYAGGYLGWDSYEQDYFGINLSNDFTENEGIAQIKRMTKDQIIECTAACLKVLYAYIGLRYRYDCLKASMDILRSENTGYLQIVKRIDELYAKAEEESYGFKYLYGKEIAEFNNMLTALPQEAWIQ